MRLLLRLLLVTACLMVLAPSTHAVAQDDSGLCTNCDKPVADVAGAGDKIRTRVQVPSDPVPARGKPGEFGAAPGRTEWRTFVEEMVPACSGNAFPNGDLLCTLAVSCTGDDQIRYWIRHLYTQHTIQPDGTQTSVTDAQWTRLPGSYCLGPDDPGVPTIGQVIARVQTGFQDLPLPKAGPQVDPAPTTLVNIPTAFYAGDTNAATFSPTILGTTVNISAKATSWAWNWGDGSPVQTFSTPGVPKRPVVSHTYTTPGSYSATVTVTWTGTFSIAGSTETFEIRTPVTVTSPPVPVQVREARTELVDQ